MESDVLRNYIKEIYSDVNYFKNSVKDVDLVIQDGDFNIFITSDFVGKRNFDESAKVISLTSEFLNAIENGRKEDLINDIVNIIKKEMGR